MSVVSVRRIHDGRGGSSSGISETTDKIAWRIIVNNRFDNAQTIHAELRGTGQLPRKYEVHPSNVFLTCRKLSIDNQGDSPLHWIASAEYSSEPVKESDKEKEDKPNPVDRRAKIRWNSSVYQKVLDEDVEGKAVLNSAGDYFAEQPEVDRSYWTISIEKNLAAIPTWVLTLDNPINANQFTVQGLQIPAGVAKLSKLAVSDLQEENGYQFYVLSFDLELRPKGWKVRVLDQGFREIDLDTGAQINITDANGELITSPALLDGTGQVLSDPSPDNAVFLEFDGYEEFDFNQLPLA